MANAKEFCQFTQRFLFAISPIFEFHAKKIATNANFCQEKIAFVANYKLSVVRYGGEMTNNIRQIREMRGLKQFELADLIGLHTTNMNRIENGKASPSVARLRQIAEALNVEVTDLVDDEVPQGIPVMGYIGAGAEILPEFEQVPPEGLYSVNLPFPVPEDMIALEVKGDSMLPRYDDGDVIVVFREQRRSLESFYGSEAAVRTTDGRRFLKQILKGLKGVNLFSWNAKPIENVSLDWIGEIYVTVRSDQIRRSWKQK